MGSEVPSVDDLRARYTKAVPKLRAQGWSDEDINEMGEIVKEAVQSNDAERIAGWAGWLEQRAK